MSKKSSYGIVAILIATALLSACTNPAADRPGKWYEVGRWWDTPLSVSLAEKCADGREQALVGDGIYDCPAAGTGSDAPPYIPTTAPAATLAPTAPEAAPAATQAAPVAGTCSRDGQSVANDSNRQRTAMSYFGGTSEACIFYGEVNFGLTKDGKGLTVLMVIPANWTLNVNGMLGYAFWARESAGAVDWSISDSTANLTRADGRNEATPLVVHVDNVEEMAGLTELVRAVYPSFAFKLIPPALP